MSTRAISPRHIAAPAYSAGPEYQTFESKTKKLATLTHETVSKKVPSETKPTRDGFHPFKKHYPPTGAMSYNEQNIFVQGAVRAILKDNPRGLRYNLQQLQKFPEFSLDINGVYEASHRRFGSLGGNGNFNTLYGFAQATNNLQLQQELLVILQQFGSNQGERF